MCELCPGRQNPVPTTCTNSSINLYFRLQQQRPSHKRALSPREGAMSPTSSSADRRDHDNYLEDDDCLSDLDSEISDPSQLEEIDPVSEDQSSSPPPNSLIRNNPFLPPHLQHPVRATSFDILTLPLPPSQLMPGMPCSNFTSLHSPSATSSLLHRPEPRMSSSRSPSPHPLIKPPEIPASSDRKPCEQPLPDSSPRSPESGPAEHEQPGPLYLVHQDILSNASAKKKELIHLEDEAKDLSTRVQRKASGFKLQNVRTDFSHLRERFKEDCSKP